MNIFDGHLHIIDYDFPIVESNEYLPVPFKVDDYLKQTASLYITGGVIVSVSFQGLDQDYLLTALKRLGL